MTREIETGIDWDAVKNEMDCAEWQEVFGEHQRERQVFLGTVFSLTPSGKYYMPWACSNVEPCTVCKGAGQIDNPYSSPEHYENVLKIEQQLCKYLLENIGTYWEWPENLRLAIDRLRRQTAEWQPKIECETCGGVGSEEAHLDELFYEKLEEEAEQHGLFITHGEGDPCDIFAGQIEDIVDAVA